MVEFGESQHGSAKKEKKVEKQNMEAGAIFTKAHLGKYQRFCGSL
jgi:hypothetical protein